MTCLCASSSDTKLTAWNQLTNFLAALQNTAQRVEDAPEKLTAEDLADIRAARRAREKGEFISLEQLKTELEI